jgi:hypothetical protein
VWDVSETHKYIDWHANVPQKNPLLNFAAAAADDDDDDAGAAKTFLGREVLEKVLLGRDVMIC